MAWSAAAGDAGEVLEVRVEVDSWLVGVGADGRVGSVLGDIEGLPGWFGFHISLVLPFVYFLDTGPRNNPAASVPAFKGKSGGAVRFLLTVHARLKPCRPRNPCSSLHLNHAGRKIEIPHSESFRVQGGLTH